MSTAGGDTPRGCLRAFSLLALVLCVTVATGCGGSTPLDSDEAGETDAVDPRRSTEVESLAQVLANLQRGTNVSPAAPLVRRLSRELASLGRKCRESEATIAELAVGTRKRLAREGVKRSILKVLRTVNRSIPDAAGARCRPVFRQLRINR